MIYLLSIKKKNKINSIPQSLEFYLTVIKPSQPIPRVNDKQPRVLPILHYNDYVHCLGGCKTSRVEVLRQPHLRPFKVLAKVGDVAYRLELPQQLSRVHNTFHVSNLKKCLSDEPLAIPLDEIHIDNKLYFVEEPVEIMDREVKRLKQSRILIIKVRWNFRRGPEFTWEREAQFKKKYLHLFTNRASSSNATS
ncbi:hypothetical protein Tco_1082542 [Tanacetum coccineum]|uniref:Tf2-1-like SH3-like domain-containing protein n=1 Tax=Tanacetum coccineum TaxID=301880 RepID=A0ABQ5I2U2_9ASTR